jgi:vesicle transport through interaction with t-SNAREs protein 1
MSFESYNQEFVGCAQQAERCLSELKSNENNNPKNYSLISQVESLLTQQADCIKQMEVEARGSSYDSATKKVLIEKAGILKKSLIKDKADFQRIREKAERSSLIGTASESDRSRFLETNEKLDRQNQMIDQAHRTVAETEEIGLEITSELSRNREKIESSRAKNSEFVNVVAAARGILGSMNRRETRQRYLVVFIVVVLVIAFALAIYYGTVGTKK